MPKLIAVFISILLVPAPALIIIAKSLHAFKWLLFIFVLRTIKIFGLNSYILLYNLSLFNEPSAIIFDVIWQLLNYKFL